ncbi:hypothetical protein DVA67_012450 [Solirubrobacter sp. CPCC 204708]|uniref:MFS transporter n=1 Tax=Solirubrobacter deserti TaxID=2282478 RepID=A0ABT4RKC7_9ACTN|nr:hypothetical protein [Solirubrobacter deserti]MBE2316786.1 hypothetical protein [Solirubrobacter deserti]MDA0138999.1 hypothetical protein [Solirubrobacter deserti]
MRRAFEHPLAPALGCALACLAYLIAQPATADMAAHSYRAWLFEQQGLTVWNAQWYGGHHVLGYSLLFAPFAMVLGPALVGVAAAIAATLLFPPLARAAAPSDTAAAIASWLFTAGVLSNVAIGRMPFLLGIAFGVAAWTVTRGGRRALGGGLALCTMLASPVAGVFLMLGAAAKLLADGRPALRTAAWVFAPALAGGIALWALFPEGGNDRFTATAFWPMLAISAAGVALLTPGRRTIWAGGLLYLGVLIGAFVVPTPFGQNALRLGVLAGPSVLALAHRRKVPLVAVATVGVALLYLQWLPAVRAVAEAHGDPSTRLAFQAEARDFLEKRAQPGERVEVPLTMNHWEAADLAKVVPLARGWERQLDAKANPIFYDDERLTPARYHDWLRENAVRFVALPTAPLDYSAHAEALLLEDGLDYLELVYESPRWRIWELRDPVPPASNGASMLAAGPNWFMVNASKPTVVKYRYTPYWTTTNACVSRAPGGWTRVEPEESGVLIVQARFGIDRSRRAKTCH